MKLLSFVRLFGEKWGHKRSNRKRLTRTPPVARRSSAFGPWLEALEDRTLLSTLPPPIIPFNGHQFLPSGGLLNDNTPSVAVDPIDPSKLVAVYQSTFVDNNGMVFIVAAGAYSTNFGQTWLPLALPPNLSNPADGIPFPQASDPSVGFDRNENVYIVYLQHTALNAPIDIRTTNTTPSAITLQKFNFSGLAPAYVMLTNHIGVPFNPPKGTQVLAETGGGGTVDLALSPSLAVDTNPAAFRDPVSGVVQNDPGSGTVYVAWTSLDQHRSNSSQTIRIAASSDGGQSFTTQRYVINGGRPERPRLVVSQGTADGRIPVGQVTVVWDDSTGGGSIFVNQVSAGAGAFASNTTQTNINEATGGGMDMLMLDPLISKTILKNKTDNTFAFTAATFPGPITAITVKSLNITTPNNNPSVLSAFLVAPDGTELQLFRPGLAGPGPFTNTGFDDASMLSIRAAGQVPFTNTYQTDPNTGGNTFRAKFFTKAYPLGGQPWKLRIANADPNTDGVVTSCELDITYASAVAFTYIPISTAALTASLASIDPNALLSDLNVTVNIVHPTLNEVSVELRRLKPGVTNPQAPLSQVDDDIFLLLNRDDGMGNSTPTQGTIGPNLGVLMNGVALGTVFDDFAARSIQDNVVDGGMPPFVGHFRTDQSPAPGSGVLSTLVMKNLKKAALTRTWVLVVGDYTTDATVPPQMVNNWSMNFTFGLIASPFPTPLAFGFNSPIAPGNPPPPFKGALQPPYPFKVPGLPEVGIGPSPSIASENTLGSFDPHQGRLYVTYASRSPLADPTLRPQEVSATDINLLASDDGGFSWFNPIDPGAKAPLLPVVEDDYGPVDGFSGAEGQLGLPRPPTFYRTRLKFQAEVAVDNYTGTVAITYYDARYDASGTRVARMLAASSDGGRTFGPLGSQMYLNRPNRVQDVITRQFVDLGPMPDNQGLGNPIPSPSPPFGTRDVVFGFGDHQGLAIAQGHVYAFWAGNENMGQEEAPGFNLRPLGILTAVVTLPSGPRVINSTLGPITPSVINGISYNNTFDANHVQQLDGFVVSFDRPVDIRTFTVADVTVFYRDPNASGFDAGQPILVTQIIPIIAPGQDPNRGATDFLVRLPPQNRTGTYSYVVRPNMRDLIRTVDKFSTGFANGIRSGNLMDQDGDTNLDRDTNPGQTPFDAYAAPAPAKTSRFAGSQVAPFNPAGYFTPPFTQDSLPLILPGPHVVRTFVPGQPATSDNLVLNAAVSFLDVTFDRGMNPATFRSNGSDILRIMGPTGQISGPFSVAPDPQAGEDPAHPRTFRISFPTQALSGTYTITIGPNVQSATGDLMDANLNAGVDKLRGVPPPGQGTPLVIGNATPQVIGPQRTITSTINVADDFIIQQLTVQLRITFPYDPDLEITLIAPDGTRVRLVANAPPFSPPLGLPLANENFTDTQFDDFAPSSIRATQYPVRGFAPFQGLYQPERPLRGLVGKHSKGPWSLEVKNDGTRVGSFNNFSLTFQQTIPVVYASTAVPAQILSANPPTQAQTTVVSTIDVPDDFLVQGASLSLNISHPRDSDLEVALIAPDGTQIALFTQLAARTGNQADFTDAIFDDQAPVTIQQGGPPYFGRFQPQQPLSQLAGKNAFGRYTLVIKNDGLNPGQLNSWSLTLKKPIPVSGLGEPIADQTQTTFRIFTMAGDNPLSHSQWTAVGPAGIFDPGSGTHHTSRIGGIAVDPSDPTGNTVYVAGASGGVWKTINFLTPSANGPTYIPLTDFGPTFSLNIGGVAVFGRNGNPNQSIIFAATGEGDTGSRGVGILRSMDGGATWTVLDSTTNVDVNGNILAIDSPQRDHVFLGTNAFKILVDPKPTPSGDVIIYAAMGGTRPGIYRSVDSGRHWQNTTANIAELQGDDATDLVLDPNSGRFNVDQNPTGNLQVLYAGFRNSGIWVSPQTEGATWNKLLGLDGGQTVVDPFQKPIPVTAAPLTPTGKARIALAKPALLGNPVRDLLYEGWLYAVASDPTVNPSGEVYMTKDYGHNWTRIRIPNVGLQAPPYAIPVPVPSNDTTKPDYSILGNQGEYDVDAAVDPTNPNVVYVGGQSRSGFIRIDTTGISDPYALYLSNDRVQNSDGTEPAADSGKLQLSTIDPVNWLPPLIFPPIPNPLSMPYINLLADPLAPFVNNAVTVVDSTSRFANTGSGVRWIDFTGALEASADHHRIITMIDPLTGHTRLIWGDDQGIFSAVDNNGTFIQGIGNALAPAPGSRNGNLQITQFYYGAAQPSNLAAQVAVLNSLFGQYPGQFYGQAQDNGSSASDPAVLTNGNLTWTGPAGDGSGIVTDQTGSGTVYRFNWPCCGGNGGNFFQLNGVGRTSGLNPQDRMEWPNVAGFTIAVNPLVGNAANAQLLVGSATGRIYETTNAGAQWFLIADPTAAGMDGTNAQALAYGAPDPNSPNSNGRLNDLIYAGTDGGHIYVTFNGGGSPGAGNQWKDISGGLDGSPVRFIVTNPTLGSHEAYAVTFGHLDAQGNLVTAVYHLADSRAYDPANPKTFWQDISGNLGTVISSFFVPLNEKGAAATLLQGTRPRYLEALQADWRYAIPDNPNQIVTPPTGLVPTHPILYVGGEAGVYRSLDGGQSWTAFPDTAIDGAQFEGGLLPNAHVTELNLAIGNITTSTGRPTVSGSPDVLLATTYGRGDFAIRVAPLIFASSLRLDPTLPKPLGSNPAQNNITSNLQVVIDGLSEPSSFGNHVKIKLYNRVRTGPGPNDFRDDDIGVDVNNANQPFAYTDEQGRFQVQVKAGAFQADGSSDGLKTLVVVAIDDAGSVGAPMLFTYTLNTTPTIQNAAIALDANRPALAGGSDTGLLFPFPGVAGTFTDRITNIADPYISGVLNQAGPTTVNLFDVTDPTHPRLIGSGLSNADGSFSVHVTPGSFTTDGVKLISIQAVHAPNNALTVQPFSFTLRTTPPALPPQPSLAPTSDTGFSNTDHITNLRTPTFTGTGEPGTQIQIFAVGNPTPLALGFVDSSGNYSVTVGPNALPDGTYIIYARLSDLAGNLSGTSVALQPFLTIKTTPPGKPTIQLDPTYQTSPGTTSSVPQLYNGTAEPGSQIVIKDNGVPVDSFQQSPGSNAFTRSLSLGEGMHVVTVEARDIAGNVAVSDDLLVTVNKDTLDPDRKFIRQVYFNALGRLGSLPEWNIWVPVLQKTNGRLIVADAIERSLEARDNLVKGWYQTYLGRTPSNGEELGWANALVRGMRPEQVLSLILGSQEYFNHAASIPGVGGAPSDASFVTALYTQILNRVPAPPEVDYWIGQIARVGRTGVALGFLVSPEYRSNVVLADYNTVLRRSATPTAAEVAGWVNSGLDTTAIRIAFEASVEFFFRTTGFMP